MKSAVRLINVTKSFRKERVLKGITHSFEQGKIHGIMGFNGSGKTVMFKCILSACGSGWGSPRQSWKTPGCSCWTNRSTDWTSGAHRMCAACSMNCEAGGGRF